MSVFSLTTPVEISYSVKYFLNLIHFTISFAGVLPFIEELLRRKSRVILCANSRPILNDVTYAELSLLLSQVAEISDVIRTSLETGLLVARDSGQGSPCLDLARMNFEVRR